VSYPLPNFRFAVSLDPVAVYVPSSAPNDPGVVGSGSFSDVTGLGGELQVVAQPEGGQNAFVHQLPVRHTWGRIVLKKGVLHDSSLWDWFNEGLTGSLGARRDGAVILLDAAGEMALAWEFRAGLATKWTGPDLSGLQGAIALEALEIVHEGLRQVDLRSS
jgi:phage tail-like protein